MKRIAMSIGVPEENLIVGHLDKRDDAWDQILVSGHPNLFAGVIDDGWIARIKEYDVLHVAAVGNVGNVVPMSGNPIGRDLWYPDHPWWQSHSWEKSFEGFATGKLILARFTDEDRHGVFQERGPNRSGRCGLAMEYCYSVWNKSEWAGSSSATSALSALTFYLSQLWGTPQEVVGVLNVCAEDAGEPGIDEEYGRGIVSVVCDTVRDREVGMVTQSLQVSSTSPVFNEMTRNVASSAPFRPFFSLNGTDQETMTGHLGGELSLNRTALFLSAGAGYLPLGMRSSLLPLDRTPFMEFGTRQVVFAEENHQLSLLGTYGHSGRNDISAKVSHLGAQYQYGMNAGTISLRVGHRLVWGTVGIPGYRNAGAAPVPFLDGNPEVSFSFTLHRGILLE